MERGERARGRSRMIAACGRDPNGCPDKTRCDEQRDRDRATLMSVEDRDDTKGESGGGGKGGETPQTQDIDLDRDSPAQRRRRGDEAFTMIEDAKEDSSMTLRPLPSRIHVSSPSVGLSSNQHHRLKSPGRPDKKRRE
ncbi:hypothetical protein H112_07165 [Trichophyton rubrum D6]|uniref:Uncharacterized protein n=2 Tax=Trichophyton TaxID=5550 RepID=A0A022VTL7_TRIRU|nr:hypothetical protein H100_07190 [Trichophyton rubrum MR850]EZF38670.1 hypothetical protein H102_07150 [Trichophyton rubrum CBS 100081]EZF49294.1 hypothetical protein H103_07173 [Trichophyton rubrum CBS 288.86]EZF59922.1 hypothetical protein H104_07127 [Trichophyton rubrum CBS 289.86]EZF70369.1 hypothetical protein H105_07185 [Trichophyton soudanense CBS 452.61]EZF91731.1 hypothetical protein H113_07226 [Trichophyton rubrum MR1459]EZG03563.1 hypothetical protein H106_07010 [Trichophyton rub